jgi:hypothetical protein
MTRDPEALPTAVWSGSFRLFGVDVQCHTLDDGQRIIEADSMRRLIDAMIDGPGTAEEQQPITNDFLKFIAWRQTP